MLRSRPASPHTTTLLSSGSPPILQPRDWMKHFSPLLCREHCLLIQPYIREAQTPWSSPETSARSQPPCALFFSLSAKPTWRSSSGNTTETQCLPWSSPQKALDASSHFHFPALKGKGQFVGGTREVHIGVRRRERHTASQRSHLTASQPAAHPL